ncbi:MAG: bi-domain-containing oxidoreductase [Acidobacteria bacterium]|nr:bi-domain-containing oxidoreductase [Acidobacteriota bacterium]
MKQVVQNLKSGRIGVEEVPAPAAGAFGAPGVLVATACSLISPGTERAALELGRSSLLGKALRRPDQVKKVLDNWRREGLRQTVQKVQQRLEATRAMGYSCAGTVLESRACEIAPGTRVACVGTDAATHAEINFVPRNFVAAIPDGVSFEEASFVALGGIALHAAHLSSRGVGSTGENVAVLGLGPVGLLLAQVLRAAGCRVAGFDLREDRMKMARQLGFEHVAKADRDSLRETQRGWGIFRGFNRVFIAAGSKSAAPVEWAVEAAADRATLVVVGDVRTDLPRNACYAKELTVVYARSYGPGRYDPAYEERGEDYPIEQVRWSLRRNLEAFLELLAKKQIETAPLITHRFAVDEVARAYEVVSNGSKASLGVILQYPMAARNPATTMEIATAREDPPKDRPLQAREAGTIRVGVIGAGSYARAYLLPALKSDARARLVSVANMRGVSAKQAGEEFGFARCTTDAQEIFRDAEIDAVIIATRHRWHAALAVAAMEASKAVFLEKPMCLSEEELERIVSAHARNPVPFMLGHNRRFAPAARALQEFFAGARPLDIRYTVHAGPLPENHWLGDPAQGGRILGEVCHFVDWCRAMAGAALKEIAATKRGELPNEDVNAVLSFADGSVATIAYDCLAPANMPKERIEISGAGRTATLDDFVRATQVSEGRQKAMNFRGKGQAEMVAAFLAGVASGKMPVEFEEWAASARAILKVASGWPEEAV